MANDDKKSLSVKIDDTIEGLLLFFLRFLATHGHIAIRPYRPKALVDSIQKDPPPYTRPLTFLAIGAFLFALLIDVYPAGFTGLIDLIWFGDEFKENISSRWKEAFTLTTLITTGLPVILAVSLLAGISSRILFEDENSKTYWFTTSCYSFGYMATLLFLVMSMDTLFSGIVILFPFLKGVTIPESILMPLQILGLLVILGSAFVVPFILMTSSFIELKELNSIRSRIKIFPFMLGYLMLGTYLIAQAASIIPDLKNTYFPKVHPEVMIFEEMELEYQLESDSVDILFQVIVENKTKKDLLLELSDGQVAIELSAGGPEDTVKEIWPIDRINLMSILDGLKTNRTVIPKESNKLINMKATLFNWRNFYCKSTILIAENEEKISSGELDEAYQRLRLAYEPNFRLRTDRIEKTDRMIDHEELFKFYDEIVEKDPCVDPR